MEGNNYTNSSSLDTVNNIAYTRTIDTSKKKIDSHYTNDKFTSLKVTNSNKKHNNTILSQNYLIFKNEIGFGSYSKVYKAIDNLTNELVAIKKITKSRISNNLIQRFIREIEILKTIQHPNVIQYKNSFVTDKYIYIITEYCDGGSLKELIEKKLEEGDVQALVYQLVKGLHYLDSINILHRDIKPDNLLLTKNNILKIIDFGFSYQNKIGDELYGTICGTPIYMSPELLSGKPYSKKSDIWSLGIISYELFHSKNPYGKPRNIQELMYNIKNCKILFKANISNEFLDFLNKTIVINVNERLDFNEVLKHPWFKNPIFVSKEEDYIFSMDDIHSYSEDYLSSSQIKSTSSKSSKTDLYDSDDFKHPEPDKTIEFTQNHCINLVNKVKSSSPINIINKNRVNIIENFFEKPITFDPEYLNYYNSYNNSIGSSGKKPASDGMLNVPIRIIKSIIKSAYNSPVIDSLHNFSPLNNN